MTEQQLRAFPAFKSLPVYDESDVRANRITSGLGRSGKIVECTTILEVEECLQDLKLVPLGGLIVGPVGRKVIVAYFGRNV
jgi:hypothetical protein